MSFGPSLVSRTSQPSAEIRSRSSSLRFQFFSCRAFALLCELCHFVRNVDVSLSFEIQNSVDSCPPVQPWIADAASILF